MVIKRLIVGPLEANCYILINNKECLIIDPGDDYELIKENIKDLDLKAILLTHSHEDHIGALNKFNDKYPIISNEDKKDYLIGSFKFEKINTYGHTNDSVTYYFYEDKVMFTGDFLFKGTIGRTDLETGNNLEMVKSIKKIKKYPKNIKIYPGHGEFSTLDYEINHNPYLF